MTRPRIYGDETKCRAAIARYVEKGDVLLDQAIGVRKQYKAAIERWDRDEPKRERKRLRDGRRAAVARQFDPFTLPVMRLVPQKPTLTSVAAGVGWYDDLKRWEANATKTLRSCLQDQFAHVLHVLLKGPPGRLERDPDEEGDEWLGRAVAELRELQSALGVRRNIGTAAPAKTPFAELHLSGLVEGKVIDDEAKNMAAPRTPKQLSDAIGSAKELTEATLRGALDQLGVTPQSRAKLGELMKAWQVAIVQPASPSRPGTDPLGKIVNAHIVFLSEWRNLYGRGHGRTKYTAGVQPRHALLAADAAETIIRFVVKTMDDLELLAP